MSFVKNMAATLNGGSSGYETERGVNVTKDQLAKIKQIIENGRASGKIGPEIAAELNKAGIKPRRAEKWTAANVSLFALRTFNLPRKIADRKPRQRKNTQKRQRKIDFVSLIEDLTTCNLDHETKRFLIVLVSEKIVKSEG